MKKFILFISKSLASMTVYIENNTNLLAILNSTQVDSFYIVLRRLITFLNQRTVHSLFHMESYIARTATTPSSLASNSEGGSFRFLRSLKWVYRSLTGLFMFRLCSSKLFDRGVEGAQKLFYFLNFYGFTK